MSLSNKFKRIALLSLMIATVSISLFLLVLNSAVDHRDEKYQIVLVAGVIYFAASSILKAILANEFLSKRNKN